MLMPSIGTCVERVATTTGHGFCDEPATRKMHGDFAPAEVASRHVLAVGSETPEELAERITRSRAASELMVRCPR